ncbi:hypothetical protein PPUJ20066_10480 [Pseudomonas putida]|nr:hypothetical protein PPUJ20066_10480 [Pseudomonas putida]
MLPDWLMVVEVNRTRLFNELKRRKRRLPTQVNEPFKRHDTSLLLTVTAFVGIIEIQEVLKIAFSHAF